IGPSKPWWGIVQAASAGNVREAAHAAVVAVFTAKRDGDNCEEANRCKKDVYERFAESLVYYVVDLAKDQTASDDTRAAFRSAAEEVIRYAWPGGYERASYWSWLYPDLALRADWSPGFVNPSDKTVRYVATATVLSIRHPVYYTDSVYIGVHVSLFDLLGPLSELSLRSNAAS